jgi:hypothetical protein
MISEKRSSKRSAFFDSSGFLFLIVGFSFLYDLNEERAFAILANKLFVFASVQFPGA